MRQIIRAVGILLAVSLLATPAPAGAEGITAQSGAVRTADSRYFDTTGHNVRGEFLAFFDRYGGVETFGYPRTEAFEEDGRLVQYFQRHRMESWPENPPAWQVQLALLGDLVMGPAEPATPPPRDSRYHYFSETGHAVGPPFRDFFERRGGLTVFGYPTSGAYEEGGLLVQRFQRARLEWHPHNPPEHRVQPGLLGDQYIFELGLLPVELTDPAPEFAPVEGWFLWGSWRQNAASYGAYKMHNNEVAVRALDGITIPPGEVFRFSRVLSVPGYVPGLGYGPNNTYVWMHAGGVCAAATTFYRAAYNAGLEILEVHPHTLVSYAPVGWDATVYEGVLDVTVRNDTPVPIRFGGRLDRFDKTLSVWVEGEAPPDRTVVRRGPYYLGNLTYQVFRDITWEDGRLREERRVVRYDGYPPPLP